MNRRGRLSRKVLACLLATLALSLIGACSPVDRSTRPGTSSGPDVVRLVRLESIDEWRITGRAAIRTGRRAWQLGFDWCRQPVGDAITFTDPFGRLVARLSGHAGRAELERPGRPDLVARDGETLLAEAFGWSLPLSDLPDWLMGRARLGEITWDAVGRPVRWSTGGWRLDYLDYGRWDGIDLPRLLEARREDRSIRLRLVIEDWSPGRACRVSGVSSVP